MAIKNIIAKNKPKAHKTERKGDFWHIEFRSTGKFDDYRVPAWAKRVAESIKKGAEVTMGHDESAGKWQVQKVMIPVTVKSEKQAVKIAEDIACKVDYKCKIEKKAHGGKNKGLKEFEIYKNGTQQGYVWAENKKGAEQKVFKTYGEHRQVYEVENSMEAGGVNPTAVEYAKGGKAKHLKASKLFKFLKDLDARGTDLKKVDVNYRPDRDSDVEAIQEVEEDLYDSKTNNILESIVLISDAREMGDGGKNPTAKHGRHIEENEFRVIATDTVNDLAKKDKNLVGDVKEKLINQYTQILMEEEEENPTSKFDTGGVIELPKIGGKEHANEDFVTMSDPKGYTIPADKIEEEVWKKEFDWDEEFMKIGREIRTHFDNGDFVTGKQIIIKTDEDAEEAKKQIKDFLKENKDYKFVYNVSSDDAKINRFEIMPLFSKKKIIGLRFPLTTKDVDNLFAPLDWDEIRDGVWTAKKGNMIFSLEKKSQGVYGIGEAYILFVRKKDETEKSAIASFWTRKDNHGGESKSVDKKLWEDKHTWDKYAIKHRANELLHGEGYYNRGGIAKKSDYPELDKLSSEIAEEVAVKINLKTQHIKSKMPYKAQYVLEEVIKDLQKRV